MILRLARTIPHLRLYTPNLTLFSNQKNNNGFRRFKKKLEQKNQQNSPSSGIENQKNNPPNDIENQNNNPSSFKNQQNSSSKGFSNFQRLSKKNEIPKANLSNSNNFQKQNNSFSKGFKRFQKLSKQNQMPKTNFQPQQAQKDQNIQGSLQKQTNKYNGFERFKKKQVTSNKMSFTDKKDRIKPPFPAQNNKEQIPPPLDLTNQNQDKQLNNKEQILNSKNQQKPQSIKQQKIDNEEKFNKKWEKLRSQKKEYQNKKETVHHRNMAFKYLHKIVKRVEQYFQKNQYLKSYFLLKLIFPFILLGLVSVITVALIKKGNTKPQRVKVKSTELIEALENGKIKITWTESLKTYLGQEMSPQTIFYVCAELNDKTQIYCISNQQFQSNWKILVHEYNLKAEGQLVKIKGLVTKAEQKMDFIKNTLSFLFIVVLIYSLRSSGKNIKRGGFETFEGNKSKRFRQSVNVKFADVVGMQKAKEEIVQFIDFLLKPQKYNRLGAKIPRGALLTGPPGTGKTMIAKACAGQSNVPFFTISGSEFMEMYVGVGAQRVRDIFKEAKEASPSIIFIDQIDAVGKKRASGFGGGNDERDNTLNQLLVQMDGFNTDTNVIVFAATNQKDVLDPALTRPGRFDRLIEVDLPDLEGRRQIFLVHLKPIVLDKAHTVQQYAKRMATLTPGFSGAQIKNICNEAAIIAARHNKLTVSMMQFELATERVIGGVQKKSSLITPETRKTVAYHECGHGVTSWFLEGANPLLKLTIIPRSKGSLGFAQYLPNQNQISSKQQLEDQICVILGGRLCQEIFFKKISTGASDDLQKAYALAKNIVTSYGMSQKMGWISYNQTQYARGYSQGTLAKIDSQIMEIIQRCTNRTRKLLIQKYDLIDKLAKLLIQVETLDQNAIEGVLGNRPFKGNKQYQEYRNQRKKLKQEKQELQQPANFIQSIRNSIKENQRYKWI